MLLIPELPPQKLAVLVGLLCINPALAEDFYFDPNLFQGSSYGQNIEKFNQPHTASGLYVVDIFVNNTLVKSGVPIQFKALENEKDTEPCLPLAIMKTAQVKSLPEKDDASCRSLTQWVPQAKWDFEAAILRLSLTIPMTELNRVPRGYIPPTEWDSGALALFFRHNSSYTVTENTDNNSRYQYLWSGINAGTNLGLWQVRHQGNMRYADSDESGNEYHYDSVRTWVQRPIQQINSVISVGDN